jgi:energy-coupling factor transport system ATP-binding protein
MTATQSLEPGVVEAPPTSSTGEPLPSSLPLIEIVGLRYWYPGASDPVLDGIDLAVGRGEMVVVIGSSGGGKSTLMLALNGVVPKQVGGQIAGSVRVAGLDPLEHELHEMATKVGLVFQDPDSQLAAIFVRDEVAFGLQNLLVDRPTIESRMAEALDFVGLTGLEGRDVFSLSGGQKQRLAIASVLAMQPDVIVLDEPTANLDPAGAREVALLVAKLRDGGRTVMLVEHQINELAAIADRLVVLDQGRVRFDGSPRTVLRDHGREIRDELGLWIPQAAEFALDIEARLGLLPSFPLSAEEVPGGINTLPPPRPMARSGQAPSEESVLVRADHVRFRYRNGVDALEDVSCTIQAGEVVGLLGQNGSGKSTLAALLVGLIKPTAGELEVCGHAARSAGVAVLARDVGYVFQYPEHQFVAESVHDDVAYGLRRRHLPTQIMEERVAAILEQFRLGSLADRHPFKLSMGEKRRLSVADILVTEPRLLILDEPTAGQDRRNTMALVQLLDELRARTGLAIIVITHDMTLVANWCQRAIVLDAGRSVFDGSTERLFDQIDVASTLAGGLQVPDQWTIARQMWPGLGARTPLLDPVQLASYVNAVA